MEHYTDFLTWKSVKIVIIILTLGLFGASIYGNVMIQEEFDPWLFLDPKSYVSQFKAVQDKYYPDKGEHVLLFFSGDITSQNIQSLDNLLTKITDEASHLILGINSWFLGFQSYFTQNLGHSDGLLNADMGQVRSALTQFLFSPKGGRYQYLFTVKGILNS